MFWTTIFRGAAGFGVKIRSCWKFSFILAKIKIISMFMEPLEIITV